MQYKSKPHYIQAFKFTGLSVKSPKWFKEAVRNGRASVTANANDAYITLYNNKGDVERASIGSWICMNSAGKLFRISDEEFKESYECMEME